MYKKFRYSTAVVGLSLKYRPVIKAKSNNCCPGVLGAHALPESCCHGVVHDDRSLHQPDRTSTHLQVLPTPPSIHVPTRTSRPCPSRRPSVRTMRIRPVDLPAPPVPPHHSQPVYRPDRLSLPNSICLFPHLFNRTPSKNFSQHRLSCITSLRFP